MREVSGRFCSVGGFFWHLSGLCHATAAVLSIFERRVLKIHRTELQPNFPRVPNWARFEDGRPKFAVSLSCKTWGSKAACFRVVLRRHISAISSERNALRTNGKSFKPQLMSHLRSLQIYCTLAYKRRISSRYLTHYHGQTLWFRDFASRPPSGTRPYFAMCHIFGSESDMKIGLKICGFLPKYVGPKTGYFRVVYDEPVNANIFRMKRDSQSEIRQ